MSLIDSSPVVSLIGSTPVVSLIDTSPVVSLIGSSPVVSLIGSSPVVPGVSDGPLAAQPVALLQVEGVFSVGVLARLHLLPRQVGLLVEAPHQLHLLLRPWGVGHLVERGTFNALPLFTSYSPHRFVFAYKCT